MALFAMGRLCRPLRGLVASGVASDPALTRGAMILPPFGLGRVRRRGGWAVGPAVPPASRAWVKGGTAFPRLTPWATDVSPFGLGFRDADVCFFGLGFPDMEKGRQKTEDGRQNGGFSARVGGQIGRGRGGGGVHDDANQPRFRDGGQRECWGLTGRGATA